MVKISRLVIPGNFVEAFLYFDCLWMIGPEGDLWAFDLEKYLASELSAAAPSAARVFARNIDLSSEHFNRFSDLTFIDRQFLEETGEIQVKPSDVEKYSWIFDIRMRHASIIDMRCYYGRAYIAADDKIYQVPVYGRDDLEHVGRGRLANGHLQPAKVHDGRCFQIRCKYGVVNASCGRDGGFYAPNAEEETKGWRAKFTRFAERSMASEFVSDQVANLLTSHALEVFEAEPRELVQDALSASMLETGEEVADDHTIGRIAERDLDTSNRVQEAILKKIHVQPPFEAFSFPRSQPFLLTQRT